MPSKGEIFVNEFVVGFGFLGGLFTRVGGDPETEKTKGFLEVARAFYHSLGPTIPLILVLITILLTVVSLLGAYAQGGLVGLGAVGLAWVGGFIIIGGDTETIAGLTLLLVAIFVGTFAPKKEGLLATALHGLLVDSGKGEEILAEVAERNKELFEFERMLEKKD